MSSGRREKYLREKDHIDYAHELDIVLKPDAAVPLIGKEYGHFSGPGIPLFSIGGGFLRQALQQILVGFHARRGYYIAETPILASSELFRLSGHMDFYRENMYVFNIEDREFTVKPMNCPYHLLIFMSHLARFRSRVKLPFKIFEVGRVHRYEPSGSLYGLLRVRGFTQDDAHIITPESETASVIAGVFEEMKSLLELVFRLPMDEGNVRIRLSVSDRSQVGTHFMGTLEEWEAAERALEDIAKRIAEKYNVKVNVGVGEAAFYGPKIDLMMSLRGSSGVKEWQMGTIQFDFNLPRRFKVYDYVKEILGDMKVFVIHRALLGSLERFLGGYLEHYKGRLPFSLAPLQIAVLSIRAGEEADAEVEKVSAELKWALLQRGLRVAVKESSRTGLSGDVRFLESTLKPPVIVYVGPKEVKESTLTVSVYDHASGKRRNLSVRYGSDPAEGLMAVVEEQEREVKEASGIAPRIPADLTHMV
ncbi:MAG: His/Gly/Thr/Pro-type tRNA ligase C-terminal domain-containing protein [Acidilobaceae archaeon]|nr:His/Gly/Thr/Pro-type tRNA ligase C-terminal domain-containing protein [Acidilobaceae archaeon]